MEDDAQLASFMGSVGVIGPLTAETAKHPDIEKFPRISNRPVETMIARGIVISRKPCSFRLGLIWTPELTRTAPIDQCFDRLTVVACVSQA